MGKMFAIELPAMDTMPIEQQINLHLQYNFYPPVPSSMVQPCIDAIDAYWEDDIYREIEMPLGVYYRGSDTATAHAIVEQHRLDSWLESDEYYENEEFNV